MRLILILNVFFAAQPTSAMNYSQRISSTLQEFGIHQGCSSQILEYEQQHELDEKKTDEERIRERHWWAVFQRRICDITWCGTKAAIAGAASNYLMSNPNFPMFTGMIGMGFRDKIERSISLF